MGQVPDREGPMLASEWGLLKSLFADAVELPVADVPAFIQERALSPAISGHLLQMLAQRAEISSYFDGLSTELATLLDEPPMLTPQAIIGRFRISRFLARGGMGEVYEAEDLELSGKYALKTMRPGIAGQPGGLERFREEIRLARKVSSPYVCTVYEVGRHSGPEGNFLFFTMELLEGETLSERIRSAGPFKVSEARPLLGNILSGLAAAHELGIIHRDLKSSNVFLCRTAAGDRAIITDFGLSRALADMESVQVIDGMTPEYVAPEVLRGGPASVASDIHSFGVVAYEMLTGDLYSGDLETVFIRDAPSSWQRTIRRCLEPDLARRYSSAREVADRLGIEPEHGVSRRLVLLSSLGAVIGTAALYRLFAHHPALARTIAVLPFEGPVPLEYVANGLADRIADGLGRVPDVQVVSRFAAARLKSKGDRVAEAGAQLKCDYVLRGTVAGTEAACRIHLDVSEAASGLSKWSSTFDATEREIALIPEQALRAIVPKLEWSQDSSLAGFGPAPTHNPACYRLYLIGRFLADQRDIPSLRQSTDYFARCLALDGQFADAWAALAQSCWQLAFEDEPTLDVNMARALAASEKALALAPQCAEAHLVQGEIYHWWKWDWERSEASYRRCIALNPSLPGGHYWYSKMLYPLGRFEDALAAVNTAIRLDPLSPSARIMKGMILSFAGRLDEAVDVLRLVAAADPGSPNAYVPLSDALAFRGNFDDAMRAAETAVTNSGRQSFAISQVASLLPRLGRSTDALRAEAELEAKFRKSDAYPTEIAWIYAALADADKTLTWLEKGLTVHDQNLPLLRIHPAFAFVRGSPRFATIASQVFGPKQEPARP